MMLRCDYLIGIEMIGEERMEEEVCLLMKSIVMGECQVYLLKKISPTAPQRG